MKKNKANRVEEQILCLNAIRLLAILLVFNSHCDKIYPLEFLATGGAMGNALFFIISGYLLKINGTFLPWIRKKIMRLYPATLLVSLIWCVLFASWPGSVAEFLSTFVWPTGYWFIGALLLFQILLYMFEKLRVFDHFAAYSIVMCVVYFAYYLLFVDKSVWSVEDHGVFRQIYYFYIFSFGYCLKTKRIRIDLTAVQALILAIVTFCGSPLIKLLMMKRILSINLQFICQIIGIAFAVAMLSFALSWEKNYRRLSGRFIKGVNFFSARSLEIYLTQRTVLKLAAERGSFPLNLILAVVGTCCYAVVLKLTVDSGIGLIAKLWGERSGV